MVHSYEFKSDKSNIKVTIFSVENEELAWYAFEQNMIRNYEEHDLDIPNLKEFKLTELF